MGTDCSRSRYGWSVHVLQGRRSKPETKGRLVQQRDRWCFRWLHAWFEMLVAFVPHIPTRPGVEY
jgi:transposase